MNHIEREGIKPDFNLITVDSRVVPEYMRSIDPLGSPGVPDLEDQCSSTALQNDQQSDMEQTSPSLSKMACDDLIFFRHQCFILKKNLELHLQQMADSRNDPVTMFTLYLPLAVFSFLVKLSGFALGCIHYVSYRGGGGGGGAEDFRGGISNF